MPEQTILVSSLVVTDEEKETIADIAKTNNHSKELEEFTIGHEDGLPIIDLEKLILSLQKKGYALIVSPNH